MSTVRVLVIDDNPLNAEIAAYVLKHARFDVECAANAFVALDMIALTPPDLILMDIQMPGMDGVELTRRLKADPSTSSIVVVAFTAYAMDGDEAKMLGGGCDAYLSKPINVASFADEVKALLPPAVMARLASGG